MKDIASSLSKDNNFDEIISDLYIVKKMSSLEISDIIYKKTNIKITPRSIQRRLKSLGLTRSFSDAFKLAIRKGRKDYSHLGKPIKSSELRKGIGLKLRYKILKRDNFKCVLCGKSVKDNTILVIDHVKSVSKGGTNNPDNLRTLCRECNLGKMLLEER